MTKELVEFESKNGFKLSGILEMGVNPEKGLICLHGFERTSITEVKFVKLIRGLPDNFASFRFDFSGSGLSEGEFENTTVQSLLRDLESAIEYLIERTGLKHVSIVAHSLAACPLSLYINKHPENIDKVILIAPATNQKDLLRYWFVISQMKKQDPSLTITWGNYKEYLDDEKFEMDCKREGKELKSNCINSGYFLSGKEVDYTEQLSQFKERVLHIHGDNDQAVPLASLKYNIGRQVIVINGDHDLERPSMQSQWIDQAVKFLD